jgi:uncharacterized protein YjbI with pentapeptide repeats
MLIIALIVAIILTYIFNINVSGLHGKTLWDWLQLLIIPAVLAVGGYLFNYTMSKNERNAADRRNQTEREIAQDNQRETALQEYIDKMSELLLHEKLRSSTEEDEVRNIARVRTLTILRGLDPTRKASVLQFLHEAGLINKNKCIINLSEAPLAEANLRGANLRGADLHEVILRGADLSYTNLLYTNLRGADLTSTKLFEANLRGANLREANLSRADLSHARLSGAKLFGANLHQANLRGVTVTPDQLAQAKSTKGAIMPDDSIHL